jgi:hypothetical protein
MLIGELNQFFATPDRVDRLPDGNSESDPERIKLKPVRVNRKRPGAGTSGEEGGAGGAKQNTSEGGRTSGGGEGGGSGGTGRRGGESLRIAELRAQIAEGSKASRRRMSFTPLESGEVNVDVRASGMSLPESLRLRSLNGEPVARSKPTIAVEEGKRITLDIELIAEYPGPLDLVLTRKHPEIAEVEDEAE